ncbi:MAG: ABC-2 family transporter protein, partial [Planctomycetaceae bacterium]|nr:ABC-2 family transporter protein [Planctomycetaceae bacterium]
MAMTSPESPPAALAPSAPHRLAVAGTPEPFAAPSGARPVGLVAILSKYSKILQVSLSERMTYRADFLLGTVLRFLPLVTTILLWQAVYKGSGRSDLEGFRYREMIAYLLLTHISRMFSSMPGLAAGISRDVRDGTLKRFLIQPV